MESLLKIAVFLTVTAVALTSKELCYTPEMGHLDCSALGLTTPPPGLWPNISMLDLSRNAISELTKNSFSGFPDLRFLDLDGNRLTEMDFEILSSLTELTGLYVSKNQVETLKSPPDGIIFKGLQSFFANENRISHIDPDFFSFAPNLVTLRISENPLVMEPGRPVLNHPLLQDIFMSLEITSNNEIDSSLLSGLPNLREVGCTYCSIRSLKDAFENHKFLQFVDLHGNSINQITPGTFPSEGRIEYLVLERNPLFKLEVAALNNTMARGGVINIDRTPLACECSFQALYKWAKTMDITVFASCSHIHNCPFTTESANAQTP